ncbi:hypothetical protein [Sutcliffiella deserti]|uniref:hypothetical protein n=1 Tax=Sutcliffiella deserti TaxID=2875501 RepID=UPI001CBAD7B1|nr:hypothetical protein [Sutcliffiella deserti]
MKQLFSRFSHWLFLLVVVINFFAMFINFNASKLDIIAVIFGAIGLLGVGYLTFIVEKKIRFQRNQN